MKKIKVLVVDDSALVRDLLTQIISSAADFSVVGTASDPYDAWRKVKKLEPDVMTLDVEMPRMDGLSFLERLMHSHPMPVLMVSSLTELGCATTLRALELGAIDYVSKPKIDVRSGVLELGQELLEKLRITAAAKVQVKQRPVQTKSTAVHISRAMLKTTMKVVAIGASTGGTEALKDVLMALPPDSPPVAVVQHMPAGFTKSFAARLDSLCAVRVKEACDGDRLMAGHVLIAPGDFQMELTRSGATYGVRIFPGERVNHHCPSVDVLFESVAEQAGTNAVGVILTGMGSDGALGLRQMRSRGAVTLAQDEHSCVVYGMPKEAVEVGAVEHVVPLAHIAERIIGACAH